MNNHQSSWFLCETADPRVTGNGGIFESCLRLLCIRRLPKPGWAIENLDSVPPVPSLE